MGKKGFKLALSTGLTALLMLVAFTPASPADAVDNAAHRAPKTAAVAKSAANDPNAIDWSTVESGNCLVVKAGWGFRACAKGDPNGYWRVAFIGDSHMRQYFAPLDILAKRYHWKVTYISKSACTVGDWKLFPHNLAEPSCWDWNHKLADYLSTQEPFDLVVNSNSAFVSFGNAQMADAYRTLVESQLARGTHWLVISDNPKPAADFTTCIAKNGATAQQACALPYAKAMVPVDVLPAAVRALPNVTVADFRSEFCPSLCPAVINRVQVYRDYSHLSSNFAKTLLPNLDAVIPQEFKQKPVSKIEFAPMISADQLVGGN